MILPRRLLLLPLLWLPAACAPVGADRAPGEDPIRTVVEGFTAALETGDSTRALAYLHPEVRIYEGGHAETLQEYRAGHLAADIAFLAGVEREVLADQIVRGDEMAVYLSESATRGTFREREIDARGTETLVLVRDGGAWRIRHIHWSSR